VSIGIAFQQKLGTGIFGGEGFIMEKLDGDGLAFVHAGGYIIEKELQPGEILKVDTGCVVAFQPSVDFDIEFIKGIRNWMFGEKVCSLPLCAGPGKFGCNPCRSAAWPAALFNIVLSLVTAGKKGVYWAG